jgi:transcription antitermination factor NusG
VGVDQSSLSWYALHTRSRCEKRVRALLEARGIEPFLPLVERWRQWQDRRKLVAFPLFPGYCFAKIPRSQRATALSTPGVVQIIGNHDGPLPVPDGEIEAVRRLVTCTLPYDPHPYLDEGMPVEVIRGPLQGVRGVLVRKGSRARLVIRVTLIHQAASVELDAFDVKPAD